MLDPFTNFRLARRRPHWSEDHLWPARRLSGPEPCHTAPRRSLRRRPPTTLCAEQQRCARSPRWRRPLNAICCSIGAGRRPASTRIRDPVGVPPYRVALQDRERFSSAISRFYRHRCRRAGRYSDRDSGSMRWAWRPIGTEVPLTRFANRAECQWTSLRWKYRPRRPIALSHWPCRQGKGWTDGLHAMVRSGDRTQ